MPIGSYRFRTSRTSARRTTTTARNAQRRLEILQLHDLSPFRRPVRTENHLQDLDALDLGVEGPPPIAEASDEVDHLEGVGVRLRRGRLLNDGLGTTAWLEKQCAAVAPEAPFLAHHRESLRAPGRLVGPSGDDRPDGPVGKLDQDMRRVFALHEQESVPAQ